MFFANQKKYFLTTFPLFRNFCPGECLKYKTLPVGRVSGSCSVKLQGDRTAGAFANAGTAFDAGIGDFGLTVNDFDRFDGAGSHADAATGASGAINFSSHFSVLLKDFLRSFLLADRTTRSTTLP